MHFKIQVSVENEDGQTTLTEVIRFDKSIRPDDMIGLSLDESKQLLKNLQQVIVQGQMKSYASSHSHCSFCDKKLGLKEHKNGQYRTLFGIVSFSSPRLVHCACHTESTRTFSPLNHYFTEHISPELLYIETKWASLMSYGITANLLEDILPVGLNVSTIRNHLYLVARHQEKDLEGKPSHISGCQNQWGELPKPNKPLTVGIDGGYVRSWNNKATNFEVIVGKSMSDHQPAKRFGFVQKYDHNPRRRLMDVLTKQGMQENQQITFLSDGADNVRNLQYNMYPESEHILDWFHITMRLTVLNQFAKGLSHSDPEEGAALTKSLESAKWYLWHGNTVKSLDKLEECCDLFYDTEIKYTNRKKLEKHLGELVTYIENNQHLIPNYGEKWRYGETITTAFVESTVNEVISKRMSKKQQMQWTEEGAHNLLQTRTAVLNNDLQDHFKKWYPGFSIKDKTIKKARVAS